MTKLKGDLLSAGVDWISVTQRPSDELDALRAIAMSLAEVELSGDMFGRPYASQGYQGWKIGSITYGERPDGCLMRLGGHLAASHWRRVYHLANHVTRLDVQATYRTNVIPKAALLGHYSELKKKSKSMKRFPQASLFVGGDESVTVYSGKRVSDTFLRAYDKGLESGLAQWQGCVRYEAELKGNRAQKLAFELARTKLETKTCVLVVLGLFSKRGICARGLTKEIEDYTSLCKLLQVPARQTDVEKSLGWIAKSVRPSVNAIIQRKGAGVALQALGLTDTFALA